MIRIILLCLFTINTLAFNWNFIHTRLVITNSKTKDLKKLKLDFPDDKAVMTYLKKRKVKSWIKNSKLIVDIDSLKQRTFDPISSKNLLRNSFFINWQHLNFVELKRLVDAKYPKKPTPKELSNFTFEHIVNKVSYTGLDQASFSVRLAAGDTTEHASVLCALLRVFEYPCQLVSGMVLKKYPRGYFLLGRVWNLYQDDGEWKMIDPIEYIDKLDEITPITYLPLFEIENESISFKKDWHLKQLNSLESFDVL